MERVEKVRTQIGILLEAFVIIGTIRMRVLGILVPRAPTSFNGRVARARIDARPGTIIIHRDRTRESLLSPSIEKKHLGILCVCTQVKLNTIMKLYLTVLSIFVALAEGVYHSEIKVRFRTAFWDPGPPYGHSCSYICPTKSLTHIPSDPP